MSNEFKKDDLVKITCISDDRQKRYLLPFEGKNENPIWVNKNDNFICPFIENLADGEVHKILFNNQKCIIHTIAWSVEKV